MSWLEYGLAKERKCIGTIIPYQLVLLMHDSSDVYGNAVLVLFPLIIYSFNIFLPSGMYKNCLSSASFLFS